MKTRIVIAIVWLLGCVPTANAQMLELVNLLTEKLIRAIDLRVQEMQNGVIVLQNIQRQAENNLSSQKLAEIGGIEEKEKDLFREYYASLQQVKPSVAVNVQVTMIRERQSDITALGDKIVTKIKQDGNLLVNEKNDYIATCNTIVSDCNQTMQKVNAVLTSTQLTATDAERIRMIGLAANQLELQFRKLSALFQRCHLLSTARAKKLTEINRLKELYGL